MSRKYLTVLFLASLFALSSCSINPGKPNFKPGMGDNTTENNSDENNNNNEDNLDTETDNNGSDNGSTEDNKDDTTDKGDENKDDTTDKGDENKDENQENLEIIGDLSKKEVNGLLFSYFCKLDANLITFNAKVNASINSPSYSYDEDRLINFNSDTKETSISIKNMIDETHFQRFRTFAFSKNNQTAVVSSDYNSLTEEENFTSRYENIKNYSSYITRMYAFGDVLDCVDNSIDYFYPKSIDELLLYRLYNANDDKDLNSYYKDGKIKVSSKRLENNYKKIDYEINTQDRDKNLVTLKASFTFNGDYLEQASSSETKIFINETKSESKFSVSLDYSKDSQIDLTSYKEKFNPRFIQNDVNFRFIPVKEEQIYPDLSLNANNFDINSSSFFSKLPVGVTAKFYADKFKHYELNINELDSKMMRCNRIYYDILLPEDKTYFVLKLRTISEYSILKGFSNSEDESNYFLIENPNSKIVFPETLKSTVGNKVTFRFDTCNVNNGPSYLYTNEIDQLFGKLNLVSAVYIYSIPKEEPSNLLDAEINTLFSSKNDILKENFSMNEDTNDSLNDDYDSMLFIFDRTKEIISRESFGNKYDKSRIYKNEFGKFVEDRIFGNPSTSDRTEVTYDLETNYYDEAQSIILKKASHTSLKFNFEAQNLTEFIDYTISNISDDGIDRNSLLIKGYDLSTLYKKASLISVSFDGTYSYKILLKFTNDKVEIIGYKVQNYGYQEEILLQTKFDLYKETAIFFNL